MRIKLFTFERDLNQWQMAVYGLILLAGILFVLEQMVMSGLFAIAASVVTGVYLRKGTAKREDKSMGWPVVALTAGLGLFLIVAAVARPA